MAPQNPLTTHGNDKTMNLNPLILTNIQSSPYFKVNLYELKTYHEVIDEIYFKVGHMEPWEKGSRKTAGQTGMCGGVRGVGAGGIVSSAYCLLYKLFTLKLTKKQVIGLITHVDSPYIRGLGFMFIRYTQPPGDLWDWYVDYLLDEEEIDVKAGGGHTITIGEMLRQFLTKLEWYSTLFPRIPVPIQKDIQKKMAEWEREHGEAVAAQPVPVAEPEEEVDPSGFGEAERISQLRSSDSPRRAGGGKGDTRASPPFDISKEIDKEKDNQKNSRDRDRDRHRHRDSRDKDRERHRGSRDNDKPKDRDSDRHKERHRDHKRKSRSRDRRRSRSPRDRKEKAHRSRSRERRTSRSRDKKERASPVRSRDHHKKSHRDRRDKEDSYERDYHKKSDRGNRYDREDSYERDLRREKARQKSEKNGY